MINDILEKLSHKYYKYFGDVFKNISYNFLNNIIDEIGKLINKKVKINYKEIIYSIGDELYRNSIEICIRTFINNLIDEKNNLIGNTPKERYDYFVKKYLLKSDYFTNNIQLNQLIKIKQNQIKNSVIQCLKNLLEDLDDIEYFINEKISEISNIKMDFSDSHNDGKNVIIIEINYRKKVVYKPHNLYNDFILQRVISWFNSYNNIKYKLKHLNVLLRKNYGWQEFVNYESCLDELQVKRYMYRMGAFLLITYILDFCDLHYENIISENEFPLLIDSETMFANKSSFNNYVWNSSSVWDKVLANSIFSTLLLPINMKNRDYNNISGILGGINTKKNTVEIQTIVEAGTDNIHFCKKKQNLNDNILLNVPNINGLKSNPYLFVEDILEGFEDAYYVILYNREEFYSNLDYFSFENGIYRQIFRNTSLYQKYLNAYCHPKYLFNNNNQYNLFSSLKGKKDFLSNNHKLLVNEEIKQLKNLDIPYFFTNFFGKNLYSFNNFCINNFFANSINEQLCNKLYMLSIRDLYIQKYFIRCSFWDGTLSFKNELLLLDVTKHSNDNNINKFLDFIVNCREYYHVVYEGGYKRYYNWSLNINKKIELESIDLYSGIGSLIYEFQYNLFKNKNNDLYQLNDICAVESKLISEFEINTGYYGIFNGIGSRLYLNIYLYSILKDDKYIDNTNLLVEQIKNYIKNFKISYDVISGLSGIIIFCYNAIKKGYAIYKLTDLLNYCLEKLYLGYINNDIEQQTGFAHGYAGVSTAFILGSKLTNKDMFYEAGINLIKLENQFYDEKINNWKIIGSNRIMSAWCYGTAGILVARQMIKDIVLEEDKLIITRDIEYCIKNLKNYIENNRDSMILCHGLFGNLDVLLWYSNCENIYTLREFVKNKTRILVDKIIEKGLPCEYNMKNLNVSFMNGITGIGYYLLRTININIPCILSLEI